MFPQGLYTGMDETYDPFYNRAAWRLKFLWWPRKCELSNRWMWLDFAYQGRAVWTGPGESVFEDRWHNTTEHIIWKLKQ